MVLSLMSKWLLIPIIVVCVLMAVMLAFYRDMFKDRLELRKTRIEDKFRVILDEINDALLDGQGVILQHNEIRTVNMCNDYILISLWYGTGHLTITMVYEYKGHETFFEKTFGNVRNISEKDQRTIARNYFVPFAQEKMGEHIKKVDQIL